MGSLESKPFASTIPQLPSPASSERAASSADSNLGSLSGAAEDLGPYLSSLSLSGIRLHQVDGRNYLGRLQDADKFSQPNGATQVLRSLLLRLLLWRRQRESSAAAAWRQRLIEQQEQRIVNAQRQQPLSQTKRDDLSNNVFAPSALSASTSGGGEDNRGAHVAAASNATSKAMPPPPPTLTTLEPEADRDLTTLLRRSFDPTSYEKQQQLSRFAQPERYGLNPREV